MFSLSISFCLETLIFSVWFLFNALFPLSTYLYHISYPIVVQFLLYSSPPPTTSRFTSLYISPLTLSPLSVSVSLLVSSICVASIRLDVGPAPVCGWLTSCLYLKAASPSLIYQVLMSLGPQPRVGLLDSLPLSTLGFCQAWAHMSHNCCGFIGATAL